MDRHRVVEQGADAALGEAVDDLGPLPGEPHRVLVPDVLPAVGDGRCAEAGEVLAQVGRVAPSLGRALVEPGQLGEADRRDEIGGLVVRAERFVVVADAHPVITVEADPVGQGVVVGRGEAALAGHQVLRGVRAEHRRPELAGPPAVIRRAVSLGGVLDDREAVALGDRDERIHVGHEPVQVDRHDRLRPGRDGRLHEVGVHREVLGPDVHEDRAGARAQDDADGGVEAEADRDDLVARADAEAVQDRLLGEGPVGHEDGVADAAIGGPGLLEGLGLLAHGEHPRAEDFEDGFFFGGTDVRSRDRDHALTP